MKRIVILALAGLTLTTLSLPAEDRTPTIVTNPPAPAPTELKPIYCYFKEGLITRKSKNKVEFDITLAGDIPNNIDRDLFVTYSIQFDIDANASTGSASISYPGFGEDISLRIYKPRGTNRFTAEDTTAMVNGKKETMTISKVKVEGNKLSFELTSPLFGDFPQSKALLMASITKYENGKESASVTADQLPRGGSFTIKGN